MSMRTILSVGRVLARPRFASAATARQLSFHDRSSPTEPLTASNEGSPPEEAGGGERGEAPALTEKQKQDLKHLWGDYVDYMSHQRDKGWKT